MQQDPHGTGEQQLDHEPPDFIDRDTTRSYKETFCAAVLLWVMGRRPLVATTAPRSLRDLRGASWAAAIYVGVHYEPALIGHILSLK
jgi:hypothetical protein